MSDTDIIEKLLALAKEEDFNWLNEAAEEIKKLRADNKRLRARRDELFAANSALCASSSRIGGSPRVTPEQWIESQKHARDAGMSPLAKALLEESIKATPFKKP